MRSPSGRFLLALFGLSLALLGPLPGLPGTPAAAAPRGAAPGSRVAPRRPSRVLVDHLERHVQASRERRQIIDGLLARRRGPGPTPPVRPGPIPIGEDAGLLFEAVHQEVVLDPDTGTVDATAEFTLRGQFVSDPAFYVLVDQGLAFSGGSAPGYAVTVEESSYPPFNYASITLTPQVPAGQTVTVTLRYSGVLQCAPYGARGGRYCSVGGALNHFQDGGPFTMFYDGLDPYGLVVTRRTLTLRQPAVAGVRALASADLVSETVDGSTLITEWEADPITSRMYFMLLTGDLAELPVPGTSPPFSVYHVTGQPDWAAEMVDWQGRIVAFLDDQAGASFPFTGVGVVKLPTIDGFPGTATYGMVYLAEYYATPGAEYFEETLAHETSHVWWGVIAYPGDNSLWLVEGLATLSQYDYTYHAHYASTEPRDPYLASRYHWNALMLRYLTDPATLPALVLPPTANMPDTLPDQVVWAYFKSSATLDHLRATIGDDTFAAGLRLYRATCEYADCTTDDFQAALEAAAPPGDPVAADLTSFMDNWVYDTSYVRLEVSFLQEPLDPAAPDGPHRVTVVLAQADLEHRPVALRLPVELWLEHADGSVEPYPVVLTASAGSFEVETSEPVLAVYPNPRHDALVWSRSAHAGDTNFDRDVDGFDLVRCARLEGRTAVDATDTPGIYNVDLDFDARCDLNDDGGIDEDDLALIHDHFGTVVQP